jgi:tRNA-splicing ligase RtcB
MGAIKLKVEPSRVIDRVKDLRFAIEQVVPVGFDGNKSITTSVENWSGWGKVLTAADTALVQKARRQLGSLGGGNHFVEVQLDQDGEVWVMLHSGSRNVGKTIAERHIEKAKKIMKAYFIQLADPDLAYLAEGTHEFEDYLNDLRWCQEYALFNRQEMMARILDVMATVVNHGAPLEKELEVYCHHNYTALENHFGSNVLVTRKGAVRARTGDLGIIPGSMGTGSFIVRGLGNPESFCSCSHGAGRVMSRTEAKRCFTTKDLAEQTSGVECRKDEGVLDEIPGAYKDINQVMKDQADLVEVVAELHQVMCIKG